MNEEYEIRTVSDFLKIPEDKYKECLEDFLHWLNLHDEIAKYPPELIRMEREIFLWRDDGLREINEVRVTNLD